MGRNCYRQSSCFGFTQGYGNFFIIIKARGRPFAWRVNAACHNELEPVGPFRYALSHCFAHTIDAVGST
jgi:hypothetical protein